MPSVSQNNLNVNDSVELLSYIINVTPELRGEIDLPVQGQSIQPIGKLIMGNPVYKNAFLNTINIIGKTVITRNHWENPWRKFTDKGTLSYGQQVRDIIVDIADIYDYNNFADRPHAFLETEVPNVLQNITEVNYQKFYKTTTSDEQMAMAFETGDLFSLIDEIIGSMFEGMEYDDFLVAKYILARRILDGTITSVTIPNFANSTTREIVAFMKGISNKLIFRSPNYNPAGLRKATPYDRQRTILNTDFDGKVTTEVLATSYFLNQAEMKTKLALIDGFNDLDEARLSSLLGNSYVALTEGDKTKLANVVGAIISDEFFKDFYYSLDTRSESQGATKVTEFYNPETLDNTLWLHAWRIFSTSPFANAVVFTSGSNDVTAVDVDPATATVSAGQNVQLTADVTVSGIANKSVQWTVDKDSVDNDVTVDVNGLVKVPSSYTTGTQGVYTLDIGTALAEGEVLEIDGIKYTAAAADNTNVKQATAIKALLDANAVFSSKYTVTRSSATLTFSEKAGSYGVGKPIIDDSDLSTGVVTEAVTTQGVAGASGTITVTATSIYKPSVSDTATITVA